MNDKKPIVILIIAILITALVVHRIDRAHIKEDSRPPQIISYATGERNVDHADVARGIRHQTLHEKDTAESKVKEQDQIVDTDARNKLDSSGEDTNAFSEGLALEGDSNQTKSAFRQCHPMLTSVAEWTPPTCPAEIQEMDQLDPALADHICHEWLLAPFTGPRKLADDTKIHYSQARQSAIVDRILHQKKNGFFIECGAAGGEGNSNSLFFEKHRNWTGLLIEANPKFFNLLLGTNRHAYMVNACLSPKRQPSVLDFRVAEQIGGLVNFMSEAHRNRVEREKGRKPSIKIQCFPLISILKALGVTHVDYFSLDIEGAELDILETIPFDEIQIDVFSIEYVISRDKAGSKAKLEKIKDLLVNRNGYTVLPQRGLDVFLTKL